VDDLVQKAEEIRERACFGDLVALGGGILAVLPCEVRRLLARHCQLPFGSLRVRGRAWGSRYRVQGLQGLGFKTQDLRYRV